ncbi:MAG: flagellar hook-length control protein FliK [Deltaproteobacteria bacterium]|nr:flagellar hook-length control protein FliK [Deltaproteobacteria bacterium]
MRIATSTGSHSSAISPTKAVNSSGAVFDPHATNKRKTAEREAPAVSKKANLSERSRDKHPAREGLEEQPDGSYRVSHWASHMAPQSAPTVPLSRAPQAGKIQQDQPSSEPEALGLSDLRMGRARGELRLHGLLDQGRHRGVEVRATEHNGQVRIELHASDPAGRERLRAELPELRELLVAQGINCADVRVGQPRESAASHEHRENTSRDNSGSISDFAGNQEKQRQREETPRDEFALREFGTHRESPPEVPREDPESEDAVRELHL